MSILSNLGSYVLLAIVFLTMISILVAAHELGHYLFARLFGMGVEEFAIGFGKKPLFRWMTRTYTVRDENDPEVVRTETTNFNIRPWPLGGFVKIKGMQPEDDGSEVDIPGGFYNKSPWKRFVVLLAGPAFSVLAGVLLLVPLYSQLGIERLANKPILGAMSEEGNGYKAGLRPGDKIVSIDGTPTKTFYDFLIAIRTSDAKPLHFNIERTIKEKDKPVRTENLSFVAAGKYGDNDSMVLDKNLEPTGEFRRQPVLGVMFTTETLFVPVSIGEATKAALNEPVRMVRNLFGLISRPKNFSSSVSGPATMVQATQFAMEQGMHKVIQLAALISISLGIFNLLPFAPLDGGQIVVSILEMLRRGKRLSINVQTALQNVGLSLIVMLMLGAWFFDFKRIISPDQGPKIAREAPSASTPPKK